MLKTVWPQAPKNSQEWGLLTGYLVIIAAVAVVRIVLRPQKEKR